MAITAVSLNECQGDILPPPLKCGANNYVTTMNFWDMINAHKNGDQYLKYYAFYAFFLLTAIGLAYLVSREILQFKHDGRKYFHTKVRETK